MELNDKDGYLNAKAFRHATDLIRNELGLKAKEIAAKIGIDETAFSKLRSGTQKLEKSHIEGMEAAFPGFIANMEAYLGGRKTMPPERQVAVSKEVSADIEFLKKQVELWQMMYFNQSGMPESERDAFIKKITGL